MTALSGSGADTLSFSSPPPAFALPSRLGQSWNMVKSSSTYTEHLSDKDGDWGSAECSGRGWAPDLWRWLLFFFFFFSPQKIWGYCCAVLVENEPSTLECLLVTLISWRLGKEASGWSAVPGKNAKPSVFFFFMTLMTDTYINAIDAFPYNGPGTSNGAMLAGRDRVYAWFACRMSASRRKKGRKTLTFH